MTKNILKKCSVMISFILAVTLAGCGKSDGNSGEGVPLVDNIQNNTSREESGSVDEDLNSSTVTVDAVTELEVCFGDEGEPFILHLYDNETAAAIARHVGTADWRLPIYHFDYTEEFKEAVEDNPVLEGWGNKIVLINSAK